MRRQSNHFFQFRFVFFIALVYVCLVPTQAVSDETASVVADGQTESRKYGSIKLKINGFKNTDGQAMIALHNTKKTYLKKVAPYRGAKVKVTGEEITYTFDGVPYGRYGVAVFHDENGNSDLDLGAMWIPKERYGFSNNVKGRFGPPKYKRITFLLEDNDITLDINVRKPWPAKE